PRDKYGNTTDENCENFRVVMSQKQAAAANSERRDSGPTSFRSELLAHKEAS
ncbi:MAG: hypothetical protein SGPRY_003358, partial [Prymnesium sp.]